MALFFPVSEEQANTDGQQRAKELCHRCPVRSDCLAWVMASHQEFGVFGGLNGVERRQLRRTPLDLAR